MAETPKQGNQSSNQSGNKSSGQGNNKGSQGLKTRNDDRGNSNTVVVKKGSHSNSDNKSR